MSTNIQGLSPEQVTVIKNHLNMVFFHDIDPSVSPDPEIQEKLNDIHLGTPSPVTVTYPASGFYRPP